MVTANTLTGTITIVAPLTILWWPCYLASQVSMASSMVRSRGGYYDYVSSKFSNALIIVDPDPNNDGNPADATIAGWILLASLDTTATDDAITGNRGMGGQGILTIPVVYNEWVQHLPDTWKNLLTPAQRNPIQ